MAHHRRLTATVLLVALIICLSHQPARAWRSNTSTPSLTPSLTLGASRSLTSSPTDIPTRSQSTSSTPTRTRGDTRSVSCTNLGTPTPTETHQPTKSPTASIVPTPTVEPTRSSTPSDVPTVSASTSLLPTTSNSFSPSPSVSATRSDSPAKSASVTLSSPPSRTASTTRSSSETSSASHSEGTPTLSPSLSTSKNTASASRGTHSATQSEGSPSATGGTPSPTQSTTGSHSPSPTVSTSVTVGSESLSISLPLTPSPQPTESEMPTSTASVVLSASASDSLSSTRSAGTNSRSLSGGTPTVSRTSSFPTASRSTSVSGGTPTLSPTSSYSTSQTVSRSRTLSPTISPTVPRTKTLTLSLSHPPTATATIPPTRTRTFTPTHPPTASASVSESLPSLTITAVTFSLGSLTSSVSGTSSESIPPTATPPPTPTPSKSVSLSDDVSITVSRGSATISYSVSATITPPPTPTPSFTVSVSETTVISATTTISRTGVPTPTRSVSTSTSLELTLTLTPVPTNTPTVTISFSQTVSLSLVPTPSLSTSVSYSALTSTRTFELTPTASFTTTRTLSSSRSQSFSSTLAQTASESTSWSTSTTSSSSLPPTISATITATASSSSTITLSDSDASPTLTYTLEQEFTPVVTVVGGSPQLGLVHLISEATVDVVIPQTTYTAENLTAPSRYEVNYTEPPSPHSGADALPPEAHAADLVKHVALPPGAQSIIFDVENATVNAHSYAELLPCAETCAVDVLDESNSKWARGLLANHSLWCNHTHIVMLVFPLPSLSVEVPRDVQVTTQVPIRLADACILHLTDGQAAAAAPPPHRYFGPASQTSVHKPRLSPYANLNFDSDRDAFLQHTLVIKDDRPVPSLGGISAGLFKVAGASGYLAVMGAAAAPVAAAHANRVTALVQIAQCSNRLEGELNFPSNPTNSRLGNIRLLQPYVGAMSANTLLIVGVGLLQLIVAAVWTLVHRGSGGNRKPLMVSLADVRFPGLLIIPTMLLMQPAISSAVIVIFDDFSNASMIVGGWFILFLYIVGFVVLVIFFASTFRADYCVKFTPEVIATLPFAAKFSVWFYGSGKWLTRTEDVECGFKFTRLFGHLFVPYKPQMKEFVCAEFSLCAACGVLEGLRYHPSVSCEVLIILMLLCFTAYMVAMLKRRPYAAKALDSLMCLVSVIQCVSAAILLAYTYNRDMESLLTVGVVLVMFSAVAVVMKALLDVGLVLLDGALRVARHLCGVGKKSNLRLFDAKSLADLDDGEGDDKDVDALEAMKSDQRDSYVAPALVLPQQQALDTESVFIVAGDEAAPAAVASEATPPPALTVPIVDHGHLTTPAADVFEVWEGVEPPKWIPGQGYDPFVFSGRVNPNNPINHRELTAFDIETSPNGGRDSRQPTLPAVGEPSRRHHGGGAPTAVSIEALVASTGMEPPTQDQGGEDEDTLDKTVGSDTLELSTIIRNFKVSRKPWGMSMSLTNDGATPSPPPPATAAAAGLRGDSPDPPGMMVHRSESFMGRIVVNPMRRTSFRNAPTTAAHEQESTSDSGFSNTLSNDNNGDANVPATTTSAAGNLSAFNALINRLNEAGPQDEEEEDDSEIHSMELDPAQLQL